MHFSWSPGSPVARKDCCQASRVADVFLLSMRIFHPGACCPEYVALWGLVAIVVLCRQKLRVRERAWEMQNNETFLSSEFSESQLGPLDSLWLGQPIAARKAITEGSLEFPLGAPLKQPWAVQLGLGAASDSRY